MLRFSQFLFFVVFFFLAGGGEAFAQNFQISSQQAQNPAANGIDQPAARSPRPVAGRFSELLTQRRFKAPMLINSKYLLSYFYEGMEPDSGYVLGDGDWLFTYSITKTNIFEFDENNDKAFRGNRGQADAFTPDEDTFYSLYADIEYTERRASIYYGFGDYLEFGLTSRELIIGNGESLDNLIEVFHELVGTTEQKRNVTHQNLNEYYIYDNEKRKLAFKITDPPRGYLTASWVLGLKWNIFATSRHAMALKVKKAIGQGGISAYNEVDDPELQSDKRSNFNWSLHYSYVIPKFNLHLGFSQTQHQETVLPHIKKSMDFYSLGVSYRTHPNVSMVAQTLVFSHLFEIRRKESLPLLIEYILGLRFHFMDSHQIDLSVLENQSTGPELIDVGFRLSYTTHF